MDALNAFVLENFVLLLVLAVLGAVVCSVASWVKDVLTY